MTKWRSFFVLGVLALLTVTCSIRTYGQAGTATVSGRVADSSGLAVPQAKVQAVNINTNITYSAETGNDGLYNLPNLPPGRYRIVVQKQGFEEIVNSGLDLHVADSISLNFTLRVGSISQSVTVEAAAPLVNTTNGTLGGLVNEQRVADLPLNGRNYIDLTLLQPGITQHRNLGPNPSNAGLWYSSNGAPVHSNNYLLDGARLNSLQGVNGASAAG
jgi:hypothetical protein